MGMLSEQINKIRKVAKCVYLAADKEVADDIASTLNQATETIEALSAKLAAVNMERSDRYYGGGWISCEDRLPENRKDVLVCWGGNNISVGYFVYGGAGGWFFDYGFDYKGNSKIPYNPFAWQPLPEPYRPQPQRS